MESNVRCVCDINFYSGMFFSYTCPYLITRYKGVIRMYSLQSLLSDPNPNSPANSMAAQLYKENRREYEKRVKMCVEQSFVD